MRTCKSCCFYEQCGQRKTCEYYAPTDDAEETREDLDEIKTERGKFRKEWKKYIERDDGEFSYIDHAN